MIFFICLLTVKNYELMCVENPSVGGVPNEERIRIAFRVLDDLVPKLGVYTRIFTKIKDDLFGMFIC